MTTPDLALTDTGSGRPALVLHGGGGPATVAMITEHLAATMRAIQPSHPGWDGTPRPESITSIPDLAARYLTVLDELDLTDVLVVGSSIGGWIGAEMAVGDTSGRITQLVLIDAVGIDVPAHPMTDFLALDARGVAEHAFHDSARFYVDPATLTPEQVAITEGNLATMKRLAGDPYMHDPEVQPRLAAVRIPTLVIWGESDRIATPAYAEAYADAFANAQLTIIPQVGHLPQIEQPAATFAAIDSFVAR